MKGTGDIHKRRGIFILLSLAAALALFPGTPSAKYHYICEDCHVLHGPGDIPSLYPPNLNFPNYIRICNITEPRDALTLVTLESKGKPRKSTRPKQALIRGSCSECHGVVAADRAVSISGAPVSPFVRHPSDAILPRGGELPDFLSPKLPEGCVDAAVCLSCHTVHGRDPNKAPKWDYAAVAGNKSGCLGCHSEGD